MNKQILILLVLSLALVQLVSSYEVIDDYRLIDLSNSSRVVLWNGNVDYKILPNVYNDMIMFFLYISSEGDLHNRWLVNVSGARIIYDKYIRLNKRTEMTDKEFESSSVKGYRKILVKITSPEVLVEATHHFNGETLLYGFKAKSIPAK